VKKAAEAELLARQQEAMRVQDSIRGVSAEAERISAEEAMKLSLGSMLAAATEGEEKFYVVENDLARYTFSNRGGRIASVELKDYKTYKNTPLMLFYPENSYFGLKLFTNREIDTGDFFFTTDLSEAAPTVVENENGTEVSFKLYADSASYVEFLYTIPKDNYMINYAVRFENMENIISRTQSDMMFTWQSVAPQNEKGFTNENNYTTLAYKYPGEESFESLGMSDKDRSEQVNVAMKWVAFKQQFFSSIFIADNSFQNGQVKFDTFKPETGNIKDFNAQLTVPYNAAQNEYGFQFYFGPNKYSVMKEYDLGIEKLIPMGSWIVGWINRWVIIPLFDWLGGFISNFGIVILIMTFIIKICIFPLTYKSYVSMAKMRVLKPEMDKINEKYPKPEDAMKKQQATMDLYRSAGASPMGGCLPLLIQFPILIAMFRFFPASIELRQQPFLWADDLSSFDSILNLPFSIPFYGDHISLFALLMGISIFISSKISYSQNGATATQMAGMKFMMLYMMPLMMIFWFNNYSSGLSYYYLLSNVITIGQTVGFRYIIDDKKLHEQMKKAQIAKKPKKKNTWQQRYEELMRQQQEMAKRNNPPQRRK
ncbi:MAG: membrane protein insertase YidC, partial [Rikenellaceae bacterium]|nr:membrane protein insertase YidC [Rikenellaceae bacterium]